jgi:hypothetical protein
VGLLDEFGSAVAAVKDLDGGGGRDPLVGAPHQRQRRVYASRFDEAAAAPTAAIFAPAFALAVAGPNPQTPAVGRCNLSRSIIQP